MMSVLRARWRRFRPNRIKAGQLALVAMNPDGLPATAAWGPMSAVQLIGGRSWSLSIIRRHPLVSAPVKHIANRQLVEEALDLLEGEYSDPKSAALSLRKALRT